MMIWSSHCTRIIWSLCVFEMMQAMPPMQPALEAISQEMLHSHPQTLHPPTDLNPQTASTHSIAQQLPKLEADASDRFDELLNEMIQYVVSFNSLQTN